MRHALVIAAVLVVGLAACRGADPSAGFDLSVRVPGAQFVEGALPAAAAGGPSITFVDVRRTDVRAGEGQVLLAGRASAGTFAIHVGVPGDPGHWTVPVGLEDAANPGELQWSVNLDFADSLPEGPITLELQASPSSGPPGAPVPVTYQVRSAIPPGALVISLGWDQQVDADLHVIDPTGAYLDPKNINSVDRTPGGPLPDPNAWRDGGILDFDSNAQCVIDGRRRENAVWTGTPPAGGYRVLVALASACGLERTSFELQVRVDGETRHVAGGSLYAADAITHPMDPGQAAGVLALEFTYP